MSRDSIRARIAAATEGPWSWDDDPDLTQDSVWANDGDIVASTYGSTAKGSTDADDARFIANARQDIPALLRLADAAELFLDAFEDRLTPTGPTPPPLYAVRVALRAALADLEALP